MKRLPAETLAKEGGTVDIIFVTDGEIKNLNKQWFGLHRPTDVIAFPDGEVYISVDTAKRQAKERGIKIELELLRLAIHGMAHIEGHDDANLKNFCRMRKREWKMVLKCLR